MKQSQKQGEKNKVGAFGEQISVNYLKKLGFTILGGNYLKKWGEIDIVACETTGSGKKIHFVEVKTVSYETKDQLKRAVSYGTYRPEENVHWVKVKKLNRVIESWLAENRCDNDWQIDVCAVRVVPREKYATIKYLPNIIID
jgi:putative endonuclease